MSTAELTKQLLQLVEAPPSAISNEERLAFRDACEKAKLSLENPLESTVRLMFGVGSDRDLLKFRQEYFLTGFAGL